jgi:hypothetical protein
MVDLSRFDQVSQSLLATLKDLLRDRLITVGETAALCEVLAGALIEMDRAATINMKTIGGRCEELAVGAAKSL